MGINLNPSKLMKALQLATPALGPMGGPLAALIKGIAGSQKGLDNIKGSLAQLMQGQFAKTAGAAQGQPASRPQPFSPTVINIQIVMNPVGAMQQGPSAAGPLKSFGKAPIVGGESQWPAFANSVNSRITGSDKSFNMTGVNPWAGGGDKTDMAAVAWAMQKNDKVRFNSDTKQFYVTNADGSTKNVASLDEVKQQINQAGGANQNNPAAFHAVGSFLNGRVNNSQSQAPAAGRQTAGASNNPMQQIVELLKKLIEMLSGGGAQQAQSAGAPAQSSAGGGPVGNVSAPGSSSGAAPTQGQGILDSAKSGTDSMISRVGSKIDSMQAEAEKLMSSDKPGDQLKAQRMMQQANRMFEMMSKMIEDIGKKATSTLKRSGYQPA